MQELLNSWQENGRRLDELAVVCDNAPCHSRFENVFNDSAAILLRLGPYSPMMNPVETIWAKVKSHVKTNLRVPTVVGAGVVEQRLVHLEQLVNGAMATVTGGDCTRATQHASSFYGPAMALMDMNVGT